MKIIDAHWEQRNIGVKTFEIELTSTDNMETFELSENYLLSSGAEYLVVKSPVNMPEFIFGLPKLGYTLVETAFSINLHKDKYIVPPFITRLDRGVGVQQVLNEDKIKHLLSNIKDNLFDTDRISIDPFFTKEQSANRYFCWTRDMITSGYKLFNVSIKDKDVGFFINKEIDEKTVYPVLAGMYPEYKDKGLGPLLLKKCIDYNFINYVRIVSSFVSNNLPIIKLWFNFGASLDHLAYVYVKHNNRGWSL